MTTLIPALEQELRLAHHRAAVAADRPPTPRRSRLTLRGGVPLVALLATLSVTAGAYAARGLWLPELGADTYGHAHATAQAPPHSETDALGVLRREQTPADRDPAVRAALRGVGPWTGSVRTNAVRKLGTLPDGRVAVLVPARVPRGFDPTLPHAPTSQLLLGLYDPATGEVSGYLLSDALGMRAGDLMWPVGARLTPAQQTNSETFVEREILAGRLERTPGPPFSSVMNVEQSRRYRRALGITDGDPVTYIGVVPDGVARVEVDGGTSAVVHDNFFAAPSTVGSKQHTVWYADNGDVVPFASTAGAYR